MTEIELFYDQEGNQRITQDISFEPIETGTTVQKNIYIRNTTEHLIYVTLTVKGEDVKLVTELSELKPYDNRPLLLEYAPKITRMKGIKAEFKVSYSYVVN